LQATPFIFFEILSSYVRFTDKHDQRKPELK